MDLRSNETSDSLMITLDGQLSESAASALPERLSLLCQNTPVENIVLDLSRCKIEGALGYGALVAFRLMPNILDKQVTLSNAMADVEANMKVLRFEKLFKISHSRGT